MKYTICFILVFCLFFSLFTACGQAPETPTDAVASVVESAVNENVAVDENSAVSQQEEAIVSKEEPAQTVSSKTSASSVSSKISSTPSKVTSKPTASQGSSASSSVQNTDGLVADMIVEYPTFTGETSLKNWLIGNHSDYFADKRNDMLSTMGNKGKVTYYRPSIPTNHSLFTLSQVEVHTPSSGFHYFYNGKEIGNQGLMISVNHVASGTDTTRITDYMYATAKAKYNGEPTDLAEDTAVYCYTYKGIDFYYYRYLTVGTNIDTVGVYWLQFNSSHMAVLQDNCDQIEEIIPLLYLQQVTVDNSAVIK